MVVVELFLELVNLLFELFIKTHLERNSLIVQTIFLKAKTGFASKDHQTPSLTGETGIIRGI